MLDQKLATKNVVRGVTTKIGKDQVRGKYTHAANGDWLQGRSLIIGSVVYVRHGANECKYGQEY